MSAAALISDLMMSSQLSGAATRAGVRVSVSPTVDALLAQAAQEPPTLVLVDLTARGLDIQALVTQLRTLRDDMRIVAFGPHVHKERLEAAAAAGCDAVISRGQFHAQMEEILGNSD